MTEAIEQKEPRSMSEVMQVARRSAEGAVPDEYRQTMPIPAIEDGLAVINVFYGPMRRLESGKPGVILFPADLQAKVSYPEGAFISLVRLAPEDAPPEIHADGSIGIHQLSLSMEEFEQLDNRLYQLYGKLFTQFIADQRTPADENERNEFRDIFNKIHEKPYIHYYRHYGGPFFEWIFKK